MSCHSFAGRMIALGAVLVGLGARPGKGTGQEDKPPPPARTATATVAILAGTRMWSDELLFHQWRIQRNVTTRRCRLLDGNDQRHASGTFEHCWAVLERIKRDRNLPLMRGKAVVLLHGMGRTRKCMVPLAKYLEANGGYAVFNVEYPGLHQPIRKDAEALASILEHLEGIEEINFVAHSMGNLVVRHYLADQTDPQTGRRPDPRIKRMVMLGPPNHGSSLAALFGDSKLFNLVLGKPGQELGRHWAWAANDLATPEFEFGIIAGGLGNREGLNPLLPGDDDGIVSVESTRLAGASDFLVLPIMHTFLNNDQRVFEHTLRFLQHGYFVAPDRRQPVGEER